MQELETTPLNLVVRRGVWVELGACGVGRGSGTPKPSPGFLGAE